MSYGVILFPSTHFALQAEKLIQGKGFAIKLIPVPRQLSSDCGVCLRILWEEREQILRILKNKGVSVEGMVPLES